MDLLSLTGTVLFSATVESIKELVVAAVSKRANLDGANLLGLNATTSPYHVWSRMLNDFAFFLVLRTGLEPGPTEPGYYSLDAALDAKR